MSFESSFRALDIRGKWPEDLNEKTAIDLRNAITRFCQLKDIRLGSVTHDGREESTLLCVHLYGGKFGHVSSTPQARLEGINNAFSEPLLTAHVTCSHNPKGWTGLKLFLDGYPLSDEDWALIKGLALRPLKIVVTGFNGCMGPIALKELGGLRIVPFLCDDSFDFKEGVPNPEDPHLMSLLSRKVLEEKADLGIAFDGDGDRLGVVDEKGNVIPADQLGILFASKLCKKHPAKFVCDVKCSYAVEGALALDYVSRVKTGYKFIIDRCKELDANFAFERSGHFFWKENHYIDDGIYAAKQLIKILQVSSQSLSEILPFVWYNEGVINLPYTHERAVVMNEIITEFQEFDQNIKVNYLDGMEISHPDYRVLIRSSNNVPELVLIIETKNTSKEYYRKLKEKVLKLLEPIVK